MGLLSRDAILAADDRQRELVPVPEWGGEVWIRGLTGAERDRFEGSLLDGGRKVDYARQVRARMLVMAICDEGGKSLFTPKDLDALGAKSAAALDRCFAVAQRLSGVRAQDLEELRGNSEPAPSGGPGTG